MFENKMTGKKNLALIERKIAEDGLYFRPIGVEIGDSDTAEWLRHVSMFANWELVAYLQQLEQEGFGPSVDGDFIVPWDSIYALQRDADHVTSFHFFDLPPTTDTRPVLEAKGSLSDPEFELGLAWVEGSGRSLPASVRRTGGVLRGAAGDVLLSEACWKLARSVANFSTREDRTEAKNRFEWGRIRLIAVQAGAQMDDFLDRTVMLTVEKLDLKMRRAPIESSHVIELLPCIEGVPLKTWLNALDSHSTVREYYDLLCDDGSLVRVIPDENVLSVLREVKAFPARRVAGNRAERFIRNPYSVMGERLRSVISPEQFEENWSEAGIVFFGFSLKPLRTDGGAILQVDIVVNCDVPTEVAPKINPLTDKIALNLFGGMLQVALEEEAPCIHWEGVALDLKGDAALQLGLIGRLLAESWAQTQPYITEAEIVDLSNYSDRVVGFGIFKPIHSPYIQKDGDATPWIPSDDGIPLVISWLPPGENEEVQISLMRSDLAVLKMKIDQAKASGDSSVEMVGWPAPIDIVSAENVLHAFMPSTVEQREANTGFSEPARKFDQQAKERRGLLIEENITANNYKISRGTVLAVSADTQPDLPRAMVDGVELLPHQSTGVAWLQNMWKHPELSRGCIFADDMGLGKTLQLLTFIFGIFEKDQKTEPVLIVVPVSLLENWQNEIRRFFKKDALEVLVLYGSAVNKLLMPEHRVEKSLLEMGLKKFLEPGWRGDAQIVLTTYETLRDFEVSLARVRWSIMICDEAQKIKTPGTLVTQAAQKIDAQFRIACTGTPVENSLTDLWSLFNFVQPGLLPPLNEFGAKYRKPREARDEEQSAAIAELRETISPQIIRRTKDEVAKLPGKSEDVGCKVIKISPYQLNLYDQVIGKYASAKELASAQDVKGGGALMLSLLHTLRMICADPRRPGFRSDTTKSLEDYRKESPKIGWLIDCLQEIKSKNEKVIIFTEFRELQRVLQHYIGQRFGIQVSVVNGDNKTESTHHTLGRQKIIDQFQSASGFNVIILSTTAMGFGVNIQAANHVIHFTRPWNPAKEDQATDRAYRIGQTRPVTVYYPTISASFITFEQKLDLLLKEKRELASDMLNGSSDVTFADLADVTNSKGEGPIVAQRITGEELRVIEPKAFEKLCQVLWGKKGFIVYMTPASGDGGVDLVAIKGSKGSLIQCKSTSVAKALGWEGVKDVVAGTAKYQMLHQKVQFERIVMTNGLFNSAAREQASINEVTLIDGSDISEILENFPTTFLELN